MAASGYDTQYGNYSLTFHGDAGNDVLRAVGVEDLTAYGGSGRDTISGGPGWVYLYGGNGNDLITGELGSGYLHGDDGDDTIEASTSEYGLSWVDGGSGDDLLTATSAGVTLNGGSGSDKLSASGEGNSLFGEAGSDTLTGGDGDDLLAGGGEADLVSGGAGDDLLSGGTGADTISGGSGDDMLTYLDSETGVTADLAAIAATGMDATGDAVSGVEHLSGSSYADRLTGDAGGNIILGDLGSDTIDGGAGDDVLGAQTILDAWGWADDRDVFVAHDGDGDDLMYGVYGTGFSTADYSAVSGGIVAAFTETFYTPALEVTGAAGKDSAMDVLGLIGTASADHITAGAGTFVDAGAGDDTLIAAASGADTLIGGFGDDLYDGRAGGSGDVFGLSAGGGIDTILGFNELHGDALGMGGFDPTGFGPKLLVNVAGGPITGTTAISGETRFVFDQSTGDLWFDADGSAAGEAVRIAVLDLETLTTGSVTAAGPSLSASDFVLLPA